jgi:hypothetical protein
MPSIAPLRESYRSLTTRLAEIDWTREAGVFLSMQLGAFVAIYTLWVFFDLNGPTVSLTRPDPVNVLLLGLPAAFLLTLIVYPVLRPLTARLSSRTARGFVVGTWLVLGLGPTVAAFVYGIVTMGFEPSISEYFADNGPQFTVLCMTAATLLVGFVGLPSAITTGRVSPSRSEWRRLAVVVVVVLLLPAIGAAAAPADNAEGSNGGWETAEFNASEYDDGEEQITSFQPQNGAIDDGDTYHDPEAVLPCETQPMPETVRLAGSGYDVADTHIGTNWFNVSKAYYYENLSSDGVVVPGHYFIEINSSLAELQRYNSYGAFDVRSSATEYYGEYYHSRGRIAMEQVDSMVIYQDVVTENGTVERYAARLCRPDR